MAQLRVSAANFILSSTYSCVKDGTLVFTDSSHTVVASEGWSTTTTDPQTITHNVKFIYDLPMNAIVTRAQLHATISSSTYGADVSTINGVSVGTARDAVVDVELTEGANSVTIPFVFKSSAVEHDHSPSDMILVNEYWVGNAYFLKYMYNHSGEIRYTDVYLLIEYRPAIEFGGWTDDPLVVGETYVKAVHMTEIQQWTALLSEYANKGTPAFTEAVAGETSLAQWLSQVQEIRDVLDVIAPDHEQWIDVSVNCPRADVMEQIRSIIVSAM